MVQECKKSISGRRASLRNVAAFNSLIADQRVPGNDPRNNCGTHFGTSSLQVTKVANFLLESEC